MEWEEFFTANPWAPYRNEVGAGMVASTIANVNRDTKKRPKPFTPHDFMPFAYREEEKPVGEGLKAALQGYRRPNGR